VPDIQIPVCLIGAVTHGDDVDTCRDGANYILSVNDGSQLRAKPTNSEAAEALEMFADAKVFVSVCGYLKSGLSGPKCDRIDAYSVRLAGIGAETTLASSLAASTDPMRLLSDEGLSKLLHQWFDGDVPEVKSKALYYIAGVKYFEPENGKPYETVAFPPEFLFVFDFGFPAQCGISVLWKNKLAGDPEFPSFSTATARSIYERSHSGLVYPARTGELLVGISSDRAAEATEWVAKHSESAPKLIAKDLLHARVKPFYELSIAKSLESDPDLVRYAELNRTIRLIDFAPGWRLTQVI
jgi:hypothetical protein